MPKFHHPYMRYARNAYNTYQLGKGIYNGAKDAYSKGKQAYNTAKKIKRRVFGGGPASGKRRFVRRRAHLTATSYGNKSSTVVRTRNRKKMLGKLMSQMAQHYKYLHITNQRAGSIPNSTCAVNFFTFDSAQIRAMLSSISSVSTQEILLQKAVSTFSISNMSNLGNVIWIYDLVLRHDADSGSAATGAVLDPINDWRNGIVDEVGSVTDFALPYCTPYQSRVFTLRWKVIKVRKIPLAAGETHIHTTVCTPRMHLNKERVLPPVTATIGTPAADLGIGHFTSACMIVALGNVACDSVTAANVGFGPTNIDVVKTTRYEYDGFTDNSTIWEKNVVLGSISTAEFVQEEAGVVTTYAQAV